MQHMGLTASNQVDSSLAEHNKNTVLALYETGDAVTAITSSRLCNFYPNGKSKIAYLISDVTMALGTFQRSESKNILYES